MIFLYLYFAGCFLFCTFFIWLQSILDKADRQRSPLAILSLIIMSLGWPLYCVVCLVILILMIICITLVNFSPNNFKQQIKSKENIKKNTNNIVSNFFDCIIFAIISVSGVVGVSMGSKTLP
jgi:NADH:ubiquinone oxidoreductase subunit 6 (subunit J)